MTRFRVGLLLVVLFLFVVLCRLPLAWCTGLLPANAACEEPAGTVWSGSCARLRVAGWTVRNVSWSWLPAALLSGRLGARVQVRDQALEGNGAVRFGAGGALQLDDLALRLALPSALLPALPAGWRGTLQLEVPELTRSGDVLEVAAGRATLLDLRQGVPGVALGSFDWRFTASPGAAGQVRGPLSDQGGPVRLQGTLMVGRKGEYDLAARLSPGPAASAAVRQLLDGLGAADAQGVHTLAFTGSL